MFDVANRKPCHMLYESRNERLVRCRTESDTHATAYLLANILKYTAVRVRVLIGHVVKKIL